MMQSDSQFCTSCRQYKLPHQFKTNHLGAPYKTCLTCWVRSHCESPVQAILTLLTLSYLQSKNRRRPLEEIDPNIRSLRSSPTQLSHLAPCRPMSPYKSLAILQMLPLVMTLWLGQVAIDSSLDFDKSLGQAAITWATCH